MREKGGRGRKGARACLESAKDGAQAGLGREKAAERPPLTTGLAEDRRLTRFTRFGRDV